MTFDRFDLFIKVQAGGRAGEHVQGTGSQTSIIQKEAQI